LTTNSYGVGIRCAWYSWKACEICGLFFSRKKIEKKINFLTQAAQTVIDHSLVPRNLGVNLGGVVTRDLQNYLQLGMY
jgi:hypothetical protein